MTRRRTITLKIAMIFVAFFCAYGLREVLERSAAGPRSPNYMGVLLGKHPFRAVERDDPESNLFLESLLTIIQNYYVDQDRVAAKELALGAVSALAQTKQVSYQIAAPGDRILLHVGKERFDLDLPENPSFDEISTFYKQLASIASRHRLTIGQNHLKDPSAPYISRIVDAVLKSLDAHSSILSPEAYLELRQGTEGSFGGLGVLVGIRDEVLTVLKPIPGSPASRAGIQKNDRILSINGVNTFGKSLENLVEHMRGEPGSLVRLSLLRHGARAPADMNLRREIVQVDSIETRELNIARNKVLHITVENFAARTSREVRTALNEFRKKRKGSISGVILDLRGNPGGLLDQAVQMADIFLPSGVIVSTKGRREEIESAVADHDETGYPLVVLIDENSASASEIVAGALQDHGRAVVIGQPSFGKGSVQTIFELPDDRALKLTIARYFTPSGKSIQNTGISPDIWIQPLFTKDKNQNLLGDQRYKNERFLRHRLDVYGQASTSPDPLPRKAYYLSNPQDRNDGSTKMVTDDRELHLALKVLEKVHSTYGAKLPSSGSRASHWLALSGPEVSEHLDTMDLDVSRWLEEKHRISWTKSGRPLLKPNLTLAIDDENAGEVDIDSSLPIKWQLKNNERNAIHRVSIFIRSDDPDFETQETLVGTVPAGGTITGTIDAPIFAGVKVSSMTLSVGVVVDGTPLPYAHAEHLVQIRDKPLASLHAKIQLTEEKGGSLAGILERGEKAKLRLLVTNNGSAPGSNLKLGLINLAGSQLEVKNIPNTEFELKPGDSIELPVSIDASPILDSKEMDLGICIDGKNLKEPLRQRATLKSLPSRKLSSEKPSSIGH